jgi:hypothetical protein
MHVHLVVGVECLSCLCAWAISCDCLRELTLMCVATFLLLVTGAPRVGGHARGVAAPVGPARGQLSAQRQVITTTGRQHVLYRVREVFSTCCPMSVTNSAVVPLCCCHDVVVLWTAALFSCHVHHTLVR